MLQKILKQNIMRLKLGLNFLVLISTLFVFSMCKKDEPVPFPPFPDPVESDTSFYTGMDLSYQPFLKPYNVDYKGASGNSVGNLLDYCKTNGVNLIRVRLFHSPNPANAVLNASSLENVLNYCQQIQQSGNNILLDIHFSDTWADPGNQTTPAAWAGKAFETVNDSVYTYTKFVLNKLKSVNALPVIVQIGNETNSGFLWNYGKVWGDFESNWPNYASMINNANKAIAQVSDESGKKIKSMVHIANPVGASGFYAKLKANGAQYDMIGLSYYPKWHSKDLNEVQSSLNELATTFQKPIMIVETNYAFTLGWNDWTNNAIGLDNQLLPAYPATPEGQKAFFEKMVQMMEAIPNSLGKGVIWWAPDMVAFDGPESTNGSAFENLSVFDFDNKALPVMEVFKEK